MDKRFYVIGIFSLYCIGFGGLRFFLAGDVWGFLHHNLWLAWIPLLIAALARTLKPASGWLYVGFLVWLVFLPNAPYLVTDLIHLTKKSTLPWFDLIVIFNYALAGLFAGVLSIEWMVSALSRAWNRVTTYLFLITTFLLCGLGMMMGRDWRLKSEELFFQPHVVITKVVTMIDEYAVMKSLIYAVMFGAFYLLFRNVCTGTKSERIQGINAR